MPTAIPTAAADEDLEQLDMQQLTREMDRCKASIFLGDNAAFMATIMTQLEFHWSLDFPTAATDGLNIWWNPHFFLALTPDTRKMVLMHELYHVAFLHMLRRGDRDPLIWNFACDIRINNGLEDDHYSFVGVENCWKDQGYGLQAEEDIYDALYAKMAKPPSPSWGPGPCTPNGSGGTSGQAQAGQSSPANQGANGQQGQGPGAGDPDNDVHIGDMIPSTAEGQREIVNNVIRAIHQAKTSGQAGSIPGGVEEVIETFLKPVIDWRKELKKFFEDLLEEDYTWARPNRRHQDIYLPSRYEDEGRLEHLAYYLDVSGSISEQELIRFNSEVKYIKDTFNPKKLTLVQFDTRITQEIEITENDKFEKIKIVGRGGTDLRPVREHILENEPTAAIIFSDLYVTPMQPLPKEIPIIWATTTKDASVPFGKLIFIREPGAS